MALPTTVFSEYELRKMSIKVGDKGTYKPADCVGSMEESLNTKVITKSCRGVVVKTRVKGDGTGTLTISLHMPYDLYVSVYAMEFETLKEGVVAYGQNNVHPVFSIVCDVFDEDGNEKFKAYPNCIFQSGVARTIENGAEEVAEIEMEVSLMPDEYGNCMYEAVASALTDETVKNTWLTAFTPELVQASPGA